MWRSTVNDIAIQITIKEHFSVLVNENAWTRKRGEEGKQGSQAVWAGRPKQPWCITADNRRRNNALKREYVFQHPAETVYRTHFGKPPVPRHYSKCFGYSITPQSDLLFVLVRDVKTQFRHPPLVGNN